MLYEMTSSVIAMLFMCILNVSGATTYVGSYNGQMMFESNNRLFHGIQFGGFIVARNEKSASHEYGHYLQEKMLGPWYLPLIWTSSIVGQFRMWFDADFYIRQYMNIPTERWATQLGEEYGLQDYRRKL